MSTEKLNCMNKMGVESSRPSHSRSSNAPLELPTADLRPVMVIAVVVVVMPVEIMKTMVYVIVLIWDHYR